MYRVVLSGAYKFVFKSVISVHNCLVEDIMLLLLVNAMYLVAAQIIALAIVM